MYSAYYELLIYRRLGMARVNEGSALPATHMFTYKYRNEPYLPLTPAAERRRTVTGTPVPSH